MQRYPSIIGRLPAFLFAATLPFVPARAFSQANESSFTEYLRHNARPFTVTNGKMAGPGALWLQAEARRAQFVFLGEDHGLAEVELLTSALWRELVPLGFRHLAMEEGPWSASLLDRYVRNGDSRALSAYRSAVVPRLPPASDEHIAMVEALRLARPSRGAAVVWGLDQERRAVPLLSRLVALAPTADARAAACAVLAEAQQREAAGRFLLGGYEDQIGVLQRAFARRPSQETTWLLAIMAQSTRIYNDNDAPPAERRGYAANEEREDMMKELFLKNYRAAQRAGERQPRVLLRFGQWHGMRGYSPNNVSSLGNFVAEFARAQGDRMFNIVVTCVAGERSGLGTAAGQVQPCGNEQEAWLQPMLAALTAPFTMFDLRPLRAAHHAGVVDVPAEVVPFVYGYDALLVVSRSSALHFRSASAQR